MELLLVFDCRCRLRPKCRPSSPGYVSMFIYLKLFRIWDKYQNLVCWAIRFFDVLSLYDSDLPDDQIVSY